MRVIGKIYKVLIKRRLIGVKSYNRILYFYFQNNQISLFKRYLYPDTYIDLDYDETKSYIKSGISTFLVNYVFQIYRFNLYKKIQYYDRFEINGSLTDFLNNLGNIMFLDLEMTMPSYTFKGKGYITEIIQVGYLLVNSLGEEITRYSEYIEPNVHMDLSKRTLDFLKINAADFHSKAIQYQEFYEDFSIVLQKYHPAIVIFGKNDRLILNESFKINKVPSLSNYMRFVNLSKLIQNYYSLQNEAGLFKLFQAYYENYEIQSHDAFDDSYVTSLVFKAFKDDVNHLTNYYPIIKEKFSTKEK